jgi:hypothetical protein
MRHPLLLAAAVFVAAIPVGMIACSERRQPQLVAEQHLKTMDVGIPMAKMEYSAGPSLPDSPPSPPQPAPARQESGAPASSSAVLPETAPRIAYSYGYRFRVPGDALAALQERHLHLCRALGQARCRVVSMRRSESRQTPEQRRADQPLPEPPAAALELQVAASIADAFGSRLTASTGQAGGETVDRQIGGEDVSRQMVDSEARIRTRESLVRRLSVLLQTRSGNIQQAVEAERAINQAQEELEAARTWLAEMRGRVAMSHIAIAYEAAGVALPRLDRNPIATSWSRIGTLTTQSLAALLLVAGVVLPWLGIGLLFLLLARWHRRRTDAAETAAAPSTG